MSKKPKVLSTEEVVQEEVVQEEVVQEKPARARGIGKFITEQILTTNKTNVQILNSVLKEFEGAKTTMACIAWYKSKLRKEGKIPAKNVKVETTAEV